MTTRPAPSYTCHWYLRHDSKRSSLTEPVPTPLADKCDPFCVIKVCWSDKSASCKTVENILNEVMGFFMHDLGIFSFVKDKS